MALNNFKCFRLMPLHFKGLKPRSSFTVNPFKPSCVTMVTLQSVNFGATHSTGAQSWAPWCPNIKN